MFSGEGTDIVNGVTVLLASLSGVLFVYIAFLGQRWQLIFQQQEIRDNRNEMKASTAELKIQAKALTEQINKMDRDFVHQNFFRILDQHFKNRDGIFFGYKNFYGSNSEISDRTPILGEESFKGFFEDLTFWVDSYQGWGKHLDKNEKENFRTENGFRWIDKRPGLGTIADFKRVMFRQPTESTNALTTEEIRFIFRVRISDLSIFKKHIRSCYFLFGYMKNNNLSEYLDAVDAGMGRYERSFVFYQIATLFETDGKIDIKHWLIEHRFLANIEPKNLLSPEHIELLYSEESDPK